MTATTDRCPESVAGDGPGVTQSPSGYPSDPPPLKGPQNRVERVSDAEAAEWAALADAATEGPWVVDPDGSIGAPMAGLVCGEDGHPRPDCSECGTRVCHTSVMPGEPDAAFIAAARTAVPRLLAERKRLMDALADEAKVAEVGKAFHRLVVAERDFERGKNDRLKVQRDGLRATVCSMLGDAAAEGRCGCVAPCEGPQEDCPLHGRDYAWWVGLAGTACADRERLTAENAALWAEVGRLSVVADEFVVENLLRDRAQAVREDR